MRKRLAFIAAAVAAITFTMTTPTTVHADPSPEEVEEQVKEKSEELEAAIEEYNGAREDLKDTKERIEEIEESLPELEEEAAASKTVATDIAVASYTSGNTRMSTVNTLLDGSPTRTIERLSVLGAINAWQAADLAAYADLAQQYEDDLETLEQLKADQDEIAEDLEKETEKLEGELAELKELQAQVNPSSGYDGTLPPPPSGAAGDAVQYAYNQIGAGYDMGAAGPDYFDCSGLTMMAWRQAGVGLSHQTNAQWAETARVSRDDLVPGDLVFYNNLNHVAIYVGDGQIIHAPTYGQTVSVAGIDSMPIVGYGRPG
ncbi:NlpC/P60 family protein [Stackebrandtia albiflava]|uniref:NlpC/P60 family protein n=1 Tax=Stackebrandtia albiflava TaxID=406432 RepID=A0A562V228_9ACTN|nr:C40 family peptidase [Stackebrandtia albiflava]TWJ11895.1 NlpC/P60 family protein [Stackebrandtia albiflava]